MQGLTEAESELRTRLILWVLKMKNDFGQPDYARQALIDYDRLMPWMELKDGVREKLRLELIGGVK